MGVKKRKHDLYRKVTHTKYTGIKKIGDKGPQSWLQREISEVFIPLGNNFARFASNDFLEVKEPQYVLPLWGGGTAFVFLGLTCLGENSWDYSNWDLMDFLFNGFPIIAIIFFSIYYFTMPKKEVIFNRKKGTVTFPGWYWKKNITMQFNDIKFSYTSGGSNGIGAYMLLVVRPDKMGSLQDLSMGRHDCYKDLSFITWYMDRNRPLPPGEAFDAFREKDFLFRKKRKFPKPLYRSNIPTPEATPEQQAEREKYWKG